MPLSPSRILSCMTDIADLCIHTRAYSQSYEYFDGETLALATQGDFVPITCASVICPMPIVQDCYYDDSVCAEDEWCFVNTQEMWGPWYV